ncbi:phage tail protein [Pseudophaeobacter sp. 1A09344]|uniref:phage tail protein n=1 Tax=Pseudophaeobacter sp. 1A09344 TaxID=3098144 RepID=UPI0034D632ED
MFSVSNIDVRDLQRFENMLGALGQKAPKAVNRALNRTGDMARTQVIRTVAKETSMPQKMVRNIVRRDPSREGDLTYTIYGAGGDISLKYFKPRETRRGVTAFVRGQRELYEGAFLRGGGFARGRVELNMGGHVFQRVGASRKPIEKLPSGVVIPAEMVEGASAKAFDRTVSEQLPRRLDHEISRLLGL